MDLQSVSELEGCDRLTTRQVAPLSAMADQPPEPDASVTTGLAAGAPDQGPDDRSTAWAPTEEAAVSTEPVPGLPSGSPPEGPAAAWNPLPPRALPVFVAGELPFALFGAFLFGMAAFVLTFVATSSLGRAAVPGFAGLVLGLVGMLWLSVRRFQRTFWKLDAHGLAVREGRLWQREIRVPATRVQHLDLTRGPLQRARQLATLVVHTAGSRHDAVTVPDLDAEDAERLRDALGRQVDRDLDD